MKNFAQPCLLFIGNLLSFPSPSHSFVHTTPHFPEHMFLFYFGFFSLQFHFNLKILNSMLVYVHLIFQILFLVYVHAIDYEDKEADLVRSVCLYLQCT